MDRTYSLLSEGKLSLERLRTFLLVADAGSIAKAAGEGLGRQNLYSRHIGELGRVFGDQVKLLERRGKGIVLTRAGRKLAVLAREFVQELEDFRSEGTGSRRTLSLGAGGSLLEWLISPQMPALLALFPNSTLRLENRRTNDLVARVRDGELDFAIVRDTALPKRGLPHESLGSARYVLVMPRRLAAAVKLPPRAGARDVARLPLVLQAGGGNFHRVVMEAFAAEGADLRPVVEAESFLQVRAVVESGACAGIMPTFFAARLDPAGFVAVPLSFLAEHVRPLVLHWNSRRMAARGVSRREIKALADVLRARVGESPV